MFIGFHGTYDTLPTSLGYVSYYAEKCDVPVPVEPVEPVEPVDPVEPVEPVEPEPEPVTPDPP